MTAAFAELRLLLACARLTLRAQDRAAIAAEVLADLDWALVLRLARWHGLRPLLQRHLSAEAAAHVPRSVMVELWGESEAIARGNRAMAAELARLVRMLEARGIACVPYKGPTLALAAYAELGLREFGDLDILVPRAAIAAAKAVLHDAGYASTPPLAPVIEEALLATGSQYHLALRSHQGRMVELHWKTDPECPVERGDDAAWWNAAPRVAFEDVTVRAFDAEELMLVLCLHGSKHAWSSLGWLVDVAELLRRGPAIDWGVVAARARALGCSRRVGVGLALAAAWLDAPLEAGAQALAGHSGVAAIASRIGQALDAREPAASGPGASLYLDLAMREGAPSRVRFLAATLFQPSLAEWQLWPLPRALFFLYPALRLGRLAGKHARRGLERVFSGTKVADAKLQTSNGDRADTG